MLIGSGNRGWPFAFLSITIAEADLERACSLLSLPEFSFCFLCVVFYMERLSRPFRVMSGARPFSLSFSYLLVSNWMILPVSDPSILSI